jgi:hypothetical protein
MEMLDQGERDDKIIAVHAHDPAYNKIKDISELPAHRLAEIRSFFEDYKKNENKVRSNVAQTGFLVYRILFTLSTSPQASICRTDHVTDVAGLGCTGCLQCTGTTL